MDTTSAPSSIDDMRLMIDGGFDMTVIGFIVFALDGEDGDTVMLDQRGGHIVLRAERVRGAQATSAPPACNVFMRLAVSVVTCRQAVTRMPLSGCSRLNRFRISRRTGMEASAHSIFSLP